MRGCFVDYADPVERDVRPGTRLWMVLLAIAGFVVVILSWTVPEPEPSNPNPTRRVEPISLGPVCPGYSAGAELRRPHGGLHDLRQLEPQAQEPADSKPSNAVPVIRRKARRGRLVSKIATSRVDGPSTSARPPESRSRRHWRRRPAVRRRRPQRIGQFGVLRVGRLERSDDRLGGAAHNHELRLVGN